MLAFDRPHYFEEVLRSLAAQRDGALDRREIWLFQDGGINPASGIRRGAQARIERNIALFRDIIPDGRVFASPVNLGVALNFDRAERHAFETNDYDACIFLEDDLVLSPHYIETIDRMLAMALDDPRIGYVSACGDHRTALAEQREDPGRPIVLQGNWGFGLTRVQWARNRPFVDEYLGLVRGVDYRLRANRPIFDLYSRHGMARAVSSQDRAKIIACCLTGGLRLNTTACLARYIGRVGVHCTEVAFLRGGYDRTEMYLDGPVTPSWPSDAEGDRLFAAQLGKVAAVAPALRTDARMSFGRDGAGAKALRCGFYNPEEAVSWSAAANCELAFALDAAGSGAVRLDIEACHALPDAELYAAVGVACNDVACGSIELGEAVAMRHITVPAPALRPDGALHLRLSSSVTGRRDDGQPRTIGITALTLRRL